MRIFSMLFHFIHDLISARNLIWELTKKDLKQRYLGSYIGILWAFIQPTVTVAVFWFVFEVGFKSVPVDNFPFILWLICGMFPWFFFNDAVSSATNSIIANSFLVKKVVFRVSLLPVIQIAAALLINLFFALLMFAMYASYGFMPTLHNLQVFYYLFAAVCLVFGISLITSSFAVFTRDVAQIVGVIIQLGFWVTPIFWSYRMIPEEYSWFFTLNPMFYITDGYRQAMIYHTWFWENPVGTFIFWTETTLLCFLGVFIFKKLRPHFADML